MNRIARAGLVAVVASLAACATPAPPDPFRSGDGEGDGVPRTISIFAQNDNAEDVVLYALSPEGTVEIGSVPPERSQTFRVRWNEIQEMCVRVEIFAGPRYTTNTLSTVAPGDLVEVLVLARAERSVIRRR